MIPLANGERRISVNVTFYDKLSLARPVTATYTFRRNTELEANGYRIRHWECESNENSSSSTDDKGRARDAVPSARRPGFRRRARRGSDGTPTCRPICPGRQRTRSSMMR